MQVEWLSIYRCYPLTLPSSTQKALICTNLIGRSIGGGRGRTPGPPVRRRPCIRDSFVKGEQSKIRSTSLTQLSLP